MDKFGVQLYSENSFGKFFDLALCNFWRTQTLWRAAILGICDIIWSARNKRVLRGRLDFFFLAQSSSLGNSQGYADSHNVGSVRIIYESTVEY